MAFNNKFKDEQEDAKMKIGFIGTGVMGTAMMSGIISNGICDPKDIYGADQFEGSRKKVQEKYGVNVSADNAEVAAAVDVLFLSVKPHFYATVIDSIRDAIRPETIVITIAAGKKLAWVEEQFGKEVKIVRCMPNTPAMVCAGMTAACPNKLCTEEDKELVKTVLSGFGRMEFIDESLMNTVTGVSGSAPAYVFIFIEALADAAVDFGMPRAQAYTFAAQAVYGSAKMVLETGEHPAVLKDRVCTPGGTTIAAVRVLEQTGLRSSVFEALAKCVQFSRTMD